MLQIKNTLGGGKPEGLYVWKKYEVIGTYRYSLKSSIVTCVVGKSNDKFTITLDSSNYDGDLSYLDVKNLCKWLDGSLGIVRNSKRQICSWNGGDYLTFADHDDSSVTRYAYPSINNNIVTVTLYGFEDKSYTWNGLTKNTSFSSSIENAFEYYDYDYEYKGCIVSDKETAYPDGGEKGGYYYKMVGDGLSPEMFGCTEVAVDEVTFASRTLVDYSTGNTLNHSLGKSPRVVIFGITETPSEKAAKDVQAIIACQKDTFHGESSTDSLTSFVLSYDGSSYTWAVNASGNAGCYVADKDSTTITLKRGSSSSSHYRYIPKGTYKLVTIA